MRFVEIQEAEKKVMLRNQASSKIRLHKATRISPLTLFPPPAELAVVWDASTLLGASGSVRRFAAPLPGLAEAPRRCKKPLRMGDPQDG